MVRSVTVAWAAAAVAALGVSVEAHTNMAVPAVKWPDNFYNGNSPMGRIDSNSFAQAADPKYYYTGKINKVMESYKTLRQMIMKNVNLSTIDGHTGNKQCGLTITTGEKQPLPDAVDFPWGHPGPCEVWCDNHRIFYNDQCQGNNVGKVPLDKTKCTGVSIIQAMYVGVHVTNWEVYANCAPIVGGTKTDPATDLDTNADGSGAAGGSSGSTSGNEASSGSSATVSTKPALTPATTPAAASGDDEYDTPATTTPAATTTAPTTSAPSTSAPSTPAASKSCTKKRRN